MLNLTQLRKMDFHIFSSSHLFLSSCVCSSTLVRLCFIRPSQAAVSTTLKNGSSTSRLDPLSALTLQQRGFQDASSSLPPTHHLSYGNPLTSSLSQQHPEKPRRCSHHPRNPHPSRQRRQRRLQRHRSRLHGLLSPQRSENPYEHRPGPR